MITTMLFLSLFTFSAACMVMTRIQGLVKDIISIVDMYIIVISTFIYYYGCTRG